MLNAAKRDEMFNLLTGMSDRQVDPAVKARLNGMLGKPNEEIKDELLGLIDDAVFYSWTSDFEIRCMDHIWRNIGGTEEELKSPGRTANTPENRAKYKWSR